MSCNRIAVRSGAWAFMSVAVRLFAGLAITLQGVAAAAPTVEDFFKPSAFGDMVMSPSGKRIATTVPSKDGRRILTVVDLADPDKTKAVAAYSNADIWHVRWVNDDRIVFSVRDLQQPYARKFGRGLFAVDALGKESPRMLIKPIWAEWTTGTLIKDRALQPDHLLHSLLRDGSNDVLVRHAIFDNKGEITQWSLMRLDTTTGLTANLSAGAPAGARRWTVDAKGVPRLVVTASGEAEALYWRASEAGAWVKVSERNRFADGVAAPLYVDPTGLIFASARADTDAESLVALKVIDGKLQASTLLSTPGFDFDGGLIRNAAGSVIGVGYATEAQAQHWFDPRMRDIQARIDTLLPGTNNLLDCGGCDRPEKVLVVSTSDRQPGAYRLYDVASGKLEALGAAREWIDVRQMAQADMVRIPTRDDNTMPVHVTLPKDGKGPFPTVVLVHGGPWVRGGYWEWDRQAQFLASRGYAVIEPEYRGSTGFGFKWFRASFKQWGLAMQDDVADAAQWAIKQGHADPKRVCIAGASYGGYATLMGLIRNPEIFRCGVEWAGVTDIELIYSITWSDVDEDFKRYGMPVLVGDRVKDAAQLAATSPLKLADKIRQPLFMAYGGEDARVPIKHGTALRDAVTKTNPNVQWMVYPDEGHGFTLPANEIDFWTRVEKFLDKNLKNPAP